MRPTRRELGAWLGSGWVVSACGDGLECARVPDVGSPEAFAPWDWPPAGEGRPEWIAVAAALLAASPHNTQPWRFVVSPAEVQLWRDPTRSVGALDSLSREAHVGLGCAAENLVRAAGAYGRRASVQWLPDASAPDHVATISLVPADRVADPLADAIPCRHTDRDGYADDPIDGLARDLAALNDEADVYVTVLEDEPRKSAFAEHTLAATRAIVADAQMWADSHEWYRATGAEVDRHRDGLTLACTGLGWLTRAFGNASPHITAEQAGSYWVRGTEARQLSGAAFVLLGTSSRDDRAQQLACGRVFQRFSLWAEVQGLSVQPANQMPEQQDRDQGLDRGTSWRDRLAELVDPPVDQGVQMAFRVGWPRGTAPFASPRRPLAWTT